MTNERFSVNMENYVLDNVTGKGYVADNNIDANLIRDLLNDLHEENQRLRKIELVGEPLELFKQNRLVKRNNEELREENKQLKRRLMIAQDKIKGLMK